MSNASFIFFLVSAFVSSSSTFTIPSERVTESHFSKEGGGGGGGGGHFHSKVMRMLVIFLGSYLSLVFFRVF